MMGRLRATLVALACAAGLAGAAHAQSSAATEQRISREEARIIASRLTSVGQPAAAREIALGLLQADPRDVQALVALARAELALGRVSAAERAAQAALDAAATPTERFIASLAVADVFAQTDRFTRSQIWLRRAQDLATSPAQEQVVANAYRQVRALNPVSVSLAFGLRPSSNVNSGTSNDTVTLAYLPGFFSTIPWEVPANDRPLSGIEISGDASLRYRISTRERSQTTLDFGLYARTYVMSERARDTAPAVTGKSLSYGDLSIAIAHQWVAQDTNLRQFGASLTYERSFDADGPLSQRMIGDFSAEQIIGEDDRLAFGMSLETSEQIASGATATAARTRVQWVHALDAGRSIAAAATLGRSVSDDANRDFTTASVAVTYAFGQVLPQMDLAATAQAEWRSFDRVTLDPSGREDITTSLQLSAGFTGLEIFGFEPVATLRAQRNESSVPFFDTENVTLGLTLRSSF